VKPRVGARAKKEIRKRTGLGRRDPNRPREALKVERNPARVRAGTKSKVHEDESWTHPPPPSPLYFTLVPTVIPRASNAGGHHRPEAV
jgi:hypothetical protein